MKKPKQKMPTILQADGLALAQAFYVLHVTICLVPSDPKARTMASIFGDAGLYKKGGWPKLTRLGHRVLRAYQADFNRRYDAKKRAKAKRRKTGLA